MTPRSVVVSLLNVAALPSDLGLSLGSLKLSGWISGDLLKNPCGLWKQHPACWFMAWCIPSLWLKIDKYNMKNQYYPSLIVILINAINHAIMMANMVYQLSHENILWTALCLVSHASSCWFCQGGNKQWPYQHVIVFTGIVVDGSGWW